MTATNVMKEDEQQNQITELGHFYRHGWLEGMVTHCFVRKTPRSHNKPWAESSTEFNMWFIYLNETTLI